MTNRTTIGTNTYPILFLSPLLLPSPKKSSNCHKKKYTKRSLITCGWMTTKTSSKFISILKSNVRRVYIEYVKIGDASVAAEFNKEKTAIDFHSTGFDLRVHDYRGDHQLKLTLKVNYGNEILINSNFRMKSILKTALGSLFPPNCFSL